MKKMHVKRGDTVKVIAGKDKGREGKVTVAIPSKGKVIVEGCNIATKHAKPRRMGEQGGLLQVETAIYACKVMLVCPKCGKATRLAHKVLADGTKKRLCKKCGETF